MKLLHGLQTWSNIRPVREQYLNLRRTAASRILYIDSSIIQLVVPFIHACIILAYTGKEAGRTHINLHTHTQTNIQGFNYLSAYPRQINITFAPSVVVELEDS